MNNIWALNLLLIAATWYFLEKKHAHHLAPDLSTP